MSLFVIINSRQEFWSNQVGWTDITEATKFTLEETQTFNLPTGGKFTPLWEVDGLQFARFIAECEACGVFADEERMMQVADEMDLELDEVFELVSRAQEVFDNFKANI